jgi:hypothetical protein
VKHPLRRAFWQGYGTGLAVAVGLAPAAPGGPAGLVEGTAPDDPGRSPSADRLRLHGAHPAGSVLLVLRFRALRGTFSTTPEPLRPGRLRGELLLAAGLCAGTALLGLLYLVLGGSSTLRHARGFLLIAPLQFLGLVPRLGTWRAAARTSPRPLPGTILEPPQEAP